MARTNNLNDFLTDVADSIRAKTGKTDKISAASFDTEIEGITTGEDLSEELSTYDTSLATQETSIQDIIEALEGKATGGGEINLQDKSVEITKNGTQTITADEGYNGLNNVEITTNVTSSGEVNLQDKTVSISENTTTVIAHDEEYNGLGKVEVITDVPTIRSIVFDSSCIGGEAFTTKENSVRAIKGAYVLGIVMCRTSVTVSNGWELLYSSSTSTDGITQYTKIYYKKAESEVETFTVTASASSRLCNYMISLKDAKLMPTAEELLNVTVYNGTNYNFDDSTRNDLIICNTIFIAGDVNYDFSTTFTNNTFVSNESDKRFVVYESMYPNSGFIVTGRATNAGKLFTRIRMIPVEEDNAQTPEVGFVINECDNEGYATKITTYGLTSIPMYGFGTTGVAIANFLNAKLIEVALNDNITILNSYALANCQYLTTINLPDTITTINSSAFEGCINLILNKLPASLTNINASSFRDCKSIKIKTLPDTITTIQNAVFYGCTGLTQLSMNNVKTINGTGTSYSPFYNCTGLKAVWIGSAITRSGFNRYAFAGCTNIKKMFIDLPRATVEAFTNYQYAFSSWTNTTQSLTTDVIVCNDDAGFMTKEQFDAIDWATYGA